MEALDNRVTWPPQRSAPDPPPSFFSCCSFWLPALLLYFNNGELSFHEQCLQMQQEAVFRDGGQLSSFLLLQSSNWISAVFLIMVFCPNAILITLNKSASWIQGFGCASGWRSRAVTSSGVSQSSYCRCVSCPSAAFHRCYFRLHEED